VGGGITYIRTDEGFPYLSLLTGMWSRKIVEHHAADTLEAEGALRALDRALSELPEGALPVHHSDRGCQYCSHRYVKKLKAHGLAISRCEEPHCYGNALAERDIETGIRARLSIVRFGGSNRR
jgi:transposase InsO family protein